MPIALSDTELAAVLDAAAPLEPTARDAFLRDVATELAQHPEPLGPGVIHRLMRAMLDAPRFATNLAAGRAGRVYTR